MLKQHSIIVAVFCQSDECLRTQVKWAALMSILLILICTVEWVKIIRLALEMFVPKLCLLMVNKCTRQVALDFLSSKQIEDCYWRLKWLLFKTAWGRYSFTRIYLARLVTYYLVCISLVYKPKLLFFCEISLLSIQKRRGVKGKEAQWPVVKQVLLPSHFTPFFI